MPKKTSPSRLTPPHGLVASRGTIEGTQVLLLSYPYEERLPLDRLTPSERDVIEAVLQGRANAEIAETRGRSVRTIAKQVAVALHKLGVRSRGELAAALTRMGPPSSD